MNAHPSSTTPDTRFFGQPAGLGVLFFAEMWERFSYYGMRALLLLYLTADAARGGLGMSVANGGAIYSLYTSSAYLLALPGGWIADRLIGQRRAVLYGGVLIALGHFSLALHSHTAFFAGLVLIVIGTGLLKPNISVMVGKLYAPEDERRDAGFSIFYMGINFGAWLGPFVCSLLGEKVDWHLGFAAAGVGMTLGLVVYLGFGGALMHPCLFCEFSSFSRPAALSMSHGPPPHRPQNSTTASVLELSPVATEKERSSTRCASRGSMSTSALSPGQRCGTWVQLRSNSGRAHSP